MRPAESPVVVIGGGPVGLATAIAVRLEGFPVTVLEPRRPPIDKACGEGLMPDAVARLAELGVALPRDQSARFAGIRYLDGSTRAEARFAHGHGLGVRRPVLHQALARRAAEVGVGLEWGRRATGLDTRGVATSAGSLEARWIIGADGLHSRVGDWASLGRRGGRHRRIGLRRHFRCAPWTDLVEVYWLDRSEAYVTPVGRDEVGVAFLSHPQTNDFDRLLARCPDLGRRLAGAPVTSRDRGSGPLWQRPHRVARGRVALVGDAAGYLDAITGEGLAMGFHQADLLARALAAGDLAGYERGARRLAALPFALIRGLLFAERHPALRRRLIRTLAREPELFSRLLAIHARELSPRRLGIGGAFKIVRGLATG